jgi:hypothetical protein
VSFAGADDMVVGDGTTKRSKHTKKVFSGADPISVSRMGGRIRRIGWISRISEISPDGFGVWSCHRWRWRCFAWLCLRLFNFFIETSGGRAIRRW